MNLKKKLKQKVWIGIKLINRLFNIIALNYHSFIQTYFQKISNITVKIKFIISKSG